MIGDRFTSIVDGRVAQSLANLTAFMQPIMELSSGRIVGFEALARLRDGANLISPAQFLGELSEANRIDLFSRMLGLAREFIQQVRKTHPSLYVSVNVEGSILLQDGFCDLVGRGIEGWVPDKAIYLELLETEQTTGFERVSATFSRLQAMGIGISLDDVGSAYSSLLMLKRLPIDVIKLDQAFARELSGRPEDLQFVYSMVNLARGLGKKLIVEGVETPEIQDALTVVGVEFGQGYGIARPMPIEHVEDWLLSHDAVGRSSAPNSLLGCYAAHLNVVQTCRAMSRQPVLVAWSEDARDPHLCAIGKYFDAAHLHDAPYGAAHKRFHQVIDRYGTHPDEWERAAQHFCCELKTAIFACTAVTVDDVAPEARRQPTAPVQSTAAFGGAGWWDEPSSKPPHHLLGEGARDDLRTSDETVFFRIAETADDVIIVTTPDLDAPGPTIVYVNPAFTRLTGYDASEAIGRSPRFLQGPGTDRVTVGSIGATLRSGDEVREKVLNFSKEGVGYWLDLRIFPLRDRNGTITHLAAIERDVTADKRRLDELELASDRDLLTGIANRRAFTRIARHQIAAAGIGGRERQFAKSPSLAFVDVDGFKKINDASGHLTGDAVLLGIAERLTENVRRSDLVGRYGGDEFAVWMPAISLAEGKAIAERLCRAIAEEPFDTPTGPVHATASIGVATLLSGDDLESLMARADAAMYAAKQTGRDRVVAAFAA